MSSETNKEYSVKWKNHLTHIQKSFDYLLNSNELTDVTLYCEGKKIGAHKILLSACSTYFRDTFKDVPCQHPVIILYGVEYNVLSDILHFIYNGEVSVDTSKLDSFLKTAQLLQISGLTEDSGDRITSESEQPTDTQALDHETEQTSVEPVASSVNEDAKRGVKRPKVKEADTSRDKIVRQDSDTLFISDVKCEPSELVNFEDPLEDPLLQTEPPNEQKFYGTSAGQNTGEEEFKRGSPRKPLVRLSFQLARKGGRSLCLNGYKYLIDKRDHTNSRVYWRCHKYKNARCSGRLITDMDFNLIRVSAEHVHPPILA